MTDDFAKQNGINKSIKSDVISLFSGLLSLLCCAVIVSIVAFIPADTNLEKYQDILLPSTLKACAPEPHEMVQYIIVMVLYPVLFLLFYYLFSRVKTRKVQRIINNYNLVSFALIILVIIIAFSFLKVVLDLYYDSIEIFNYYNIVVSFGVAYLLLLLFNNSRDFDLVKQRLIFIILAIVSIVLYVSITINIDFFHLPNNNLQHHFYAWWYPVYKVMSGQTAGVDFENIYGLYPYLAAPVITLFGGAATRAVTVYIMLCQLVVAASYFAFAYTFVNNKVLGALSAFAAAFYGPLAGISGRIYLQYHPTRTLFISITLIAITLYHNLKSKKLKLLFDIIMVFVLGLGIAWNIETGVVALVVWAGYQIYVIALDNNLISVHTLKSVIKYAVLSLLSVASFFAFAEMVTYMRSGVFIDKDSILFGINAFAGTGFFMIKMYPGIWIVVAVLFIVALSLSIVYLIKGTDLNIYKKTAVGLFVMSITAIGAFSYFVGRSFPTSVLIFFPNCLLLAALMIECYDCKIEKTVVDKNVENKNYLTTLKIKKLASVFIVSLGLVIAIESVATGFTSPYKYAMYGNNQSVEMFDETSEKIKNWSDTNNEGNIPNLLLYYSCYYDLILERKASEKVCEQIDWFYLDNAHSYIDFINKHNDESFVIDNDARNVLIDCFPDEWKAIETEFTINYTEDFVFRDYNNSKLFYYKPK